MKCVVLILVACSSPPAPTALAQRPTLHCDLVVDYLPTRTFLQSDRVVYLLTVASTSRPKTADTRCVEVEFEVLEEIRGEGQVGRHVRLVVEQAMAVDVPRPAGAWWVAQESLAKGAHYTAFCPPGDLAATLRGSCRIMNGAPWGMYFARDVEAAHLGLGATLDKLQSQCRDADPVTTDFLVEQYLQREQLPVVKQLVDLALDENCAFGFRDTLRSHLVTTLDARSAAFARVVIRGLFSLPASSAERYTTHDKLLKDWIPRAIGLHGTGPKRTAADVFAGSPSALDAATAALAGYEGKIDITELWAWLKGTRFDAAARRRPR